MNDETPLWKINYYDEFACLGSKCPDNCCHGWNIPLDDEALERFRAEKGLWGAWLKLSIHGKEQKVFSPMSIRCPHLCRDGLCGLQKKRGEAFIADVCREYPRVRMNYGPLAEYHLDLSCVHAASLFLRSRDKAELLVGSDPEKLPDTYGNNDDTGYFDRLYEHRDILLEAVHTAAGEGADTLNEVLQALAGMEWRLQKDLLTRGESDAWEGEDSELFKYDLFPLPVHYINEMMSTCFYEEWLKYSAPFLYSLCRMYYKSFDKLDYKQGEERLKKLFNEHVAENGSVVRLMGDYAISLLLRRYLMAFEDYSPYHHYKEVYLGLNMVCLFYMLWCEKNGRPKKKDIAHIISVTEKRLFHNDNALKDVHAAVKVEM